MKKLSPTFLVASVVVTISLFVLLSMLFYGPSDYFEQGSADQDSPYYGFRYTVASAFFGSFGIGAYVGWMIILAWAVIIFFRESVGDLAVRAISLVVVVVSGAALADLLGSNHLGGNLGYAVGTVLRDGFGSALGVILIGAVFSVALMLATDFGFVSYYREARGALAVVDSDEDEDESAPPMDLISRIEQTVHEIEAEDEAAEEIEAEMEEEEDPEPDAVSVSVVESPLPKAPEEESPGRTIIIDLRPTIEEEDMDEELATTEAPETEAPEEQLMPAAGPIIETEPAVELAGVELAGAEMAAEELAGPGEITSELTDSEEMAESMVETELTQVEIASIEDMPAMAGDELEDEPEPARSAEAALESVFDALVGTSVADPREEELMRAALVVETGVVVDEPETTPEEPETAEPVTAEAGAGDEDDDEALEPVLVEQEPLVEHDREEEVTAVEEEPEDVGAVTDTEMELLDEILPERPILEDPVVEEEEAPEVEEPVAEEPVAEEPGVEESRPEVVLDDTVYIVDESFVAEEEAPSTREAETVPEVETAQVVENTPEPIAAPEPEAEPEIILLDDEIPMDSGPDEAEDTLLPFMREGEPEAAAVAEPEPELAEAPDVENVPAPEAEPEIPILEDVPDRGVFRSLFSRKKSPQTASVADPLLDHAAEMVIERGRASVVLLQRRLDIGYTRAARIIEALEAEGLVGPLTEAGSREILLTVEGWRERK